MRASGFAALALVAIGALAPGCAPAEATCTPACGASRTCCDVAGTNRCQDTLVDRNHCGGCGNACAASEMCTLGRCVSASDSGMPPDAGRDAAQSGDCRPGCPVTSMCCGTTCVSATGIASGNGRGNASFVNCRICGVGCDGNFASRCGLPVGMTTGSPQCLCGNAPSCTGGAVCETSGVTFTCVNHNTDPNRCGTADGGVMCATGEMCVMGVCTCNGADGGVGGHCPAGTLCTASGCLDTMNDPMNCGAVGTRCRTGEACYGGMCGCGVAGTRCMAANLMGCGQVCCGGACVYADDYNCGGCGLSCTSPQVCVHNVPFMPMNVRCGTETGMASACEAPSDAGGTVFDAGPRDAATDAALDADLDAGPDAGTDGGDDASIDAFVDPG